MPNVEQLGQRFRCVSCGNELETIEVGGGEVHCCNEPMKEVENKEEEI